MASIFIIFESHVNNEVSVLPMLEHCPQNRLDERKNNNNNNTAVDVCMAYITNECFTFIILKKSKGNTINGHSIEHNRTV